MQPTRQAISVKPVGVCEPYYTVRDSELDDPCIGNTFSPLDNCCSQDNRTATGSSVCCAKDYSISVETTNVVDKTLWFWCGVCNKGMNTGAQLELHKRSPKHLKMELMKAATNQVSKLNSVDNESGATATEMCFSSGANKAGNKNEKLFTCIACDKTMNTLKQYKEHCSGRVHQIKVKRMEKPSVTDHSSSDLSKPLLMQSCDDMVLSADSNDRTVWYWCEICHTKMNSAEHLENHKLGTQHQKKIKQIAGWSLVQHTQRMTAGSTSNDKLDSQQQRILCTNQLPSTINKICNFELSVTSLPIQVEEHKKNIPETMCHEEFPICSKCDSCYRPESAQSSLSFQNVCLEGHQDQQPSHLLWRQLGKKLIYSRIDNVLQYSRLVSTVGRVCCELKNYETNSNETTSMFLTQSNTLSPNDVCLDLKTSVVTKSETANVAVNHCDTDEIACDIEADFCILTSSCTFPSCMFHCALCDKHMNSEDGKTMHLEGKIHMENVRKATEQSDYGTCGASPFGSQYRFYCELCRVPFNTIKDKLKHESGQQHKSKVLRSIPAPLRNLPVVVKTQGECNNDATCLTRSKPREYQMELYRKAMLSDSICFLPTGTGKTLVALLTMSHMLDLNPHHSVVFIVDKVLLVLQQTKVIKDEIGNKLFRRWNCSSNSVERRTLRIAMLCGQKEDLQGSQLWQQDVIVVTAAFYINLLKSNSARWTDSCFVVFDEVHHCHKDHPFRKVILQSGHHNLNEKNRPKILGLSASPASRDTATATVSMLRELLANLGARKIIAVENHRGELAKYQSNAQLVIREVKYSSDEKVLGAVLESYFKECCKRLVDISDISDLNLTTGLDLTAVELQLNSDLISQVLDDIRQAKAINMVNRLTFSVLSTHIDVIGQALMALESIGLDCSFQELRVLLDCSFFGSFQKAKELDLPCDQLQLLTGNNFILGEKSEDSKKEVDNEVNLENTAVFGNLLEELLNWWDGNVDHRMCLVLVKKRSMASALARLLQHNAQLRERGIRVTYVVGHGRGVSNDGMSVSKQVRVMNDISKQNFDVIVATSVAEEGVDLPICDLVVQLDAPDCVRALVQVRGRARRSGSKFIAFCRDDLQRMKLEDLLLHEARMVEAVNKIITEQNCVL